MIKVNTAIIAALKPCEDRFNNWKAYYGSENVSMEEFLQLDAISPTDKIWVAVRLLPRELVEIFAIDCAVSAQQHAATYAATAATYAAAAYAVRAATAATYAATAATYAAAAYAVRAATAAYAAATAARLKERESQITALLYLVQQGDI